jgi:hypothetical protein
MADSRNKLFFVYLSNRVDERDDEVVKVQASTKTRALKLVSDKYGCRFGIGKVMTRQGLKRFYPDWHELLWGKPPSLTE